MLTPAEKEELDELEYEQEEDEAGPGIEIRSEDVAVRDERANRIKELKRKEQE